MVINFSSPVYDRIGIKRGVICYNLSLNRKEVFVMGSKEKWSAEEKPDEFRKQRTAAVFQPDMPVYKLVVIPACHLSLLFVNRSIAFIRSFVLTEFRQTLLCKSPLTWNFPTCLMLSPQFQAPPHRLSNGGTQ